MADETMFARLCAVADLEWVRQRKAAQDEGYIKTEVDAPAIVRALLTELRTLDGGAVQRAAETAGVFEIHIGDGRLHRIGTKSAAPIVRAALREFIDAILAEAGGSGGA